MEQEINVLKKSNSRQVIKSTTPAKLSVHPEEVGTGHHVIHGPHGHTHNNCIVIAKLQNYSVQLQLSLIWMCTVISIKSETRNQLYPTACRRNFAKRRWVWHLIQLFVSTSYGCQVLSNWASVIASRVWYCHHGGLSGI